MSKAAATKGRIIEQAAHLFNQQGFAGVSMADLMEATGLKKGANPFDPIRRATAIARQDLAPKRKKHLYP